MRILLLGGAGGTGSMFIDPALTAGHEVTALVRPGAKVPARAGLTIVEGDARRPDDLVDAAPDADVLVSTIGAGTSRKSNNLIQDSTTSIVAAAERTGTRRVVIQSAFGTGESYRKAPMLMKLGYQFGRDVFIDKHKGEETLRASALDWTFVYPVVLSDHPPSDRYHATDLEDLGKLRGLPRIPRSDVARFLLRAATSEEWIHRVAVLHPVT